MSDDQVVQMWTEGTTFHFFKQAYELLDEQITLIDSGDNFEIAAVAASLLQVIQMLQNKRISPYCRDISNRAITCIEEALRMPNHSERYSWLYDARMELQSEIYLHK